MANVATHDCTSFDDLCAKLSTLPHDFFSKWVFRGESSATYTLLPSLLREKACERITRLCGVDKKKFQEIENLYFYEAVLVGLFSEIANQQGLYIPNNKELLLYTSEIRGIQIFSKEIQGKIQKKLSVDLYEVFALAQHYGIPTRFLDWTYDKYVACFFALRNAYGKMLQPQMDKDDKIVLWAIDMGFLQGKYRTTQLYFVTPRYANNPNLAAQKGVLSFYNNIEESIPLDKKIEGSQLGNKQPLLYKFTLPYADVPLSLNQLYNLGYTFSRIFPGYASIATEMRELNELRKGCRALDDHALRAWKEEGRFGEALDKMRNGVSSGSGR